MNTFFSLKQFNYKKVNLLQNNFYFESQNIIKRRNFSNTSFDSSAHYISKENLPHLTTIKLIEARQHTQLIRQVKFEIKNSSNFEFKPGQWADFYIPEETLNKKLSINSPSRDSVYYIGGFSMISSPKDVFKDKTIGFIIKKSKHPVTKYLHSIQLGEQIQIHGGSGDFFYSHELLGNRPVVLIGGGIGITPLLRYIVDQKFETKLLLIHSIKSLSECFYHEEFLDLLKHHSKLNIQLRITGDSLANKKLDPHTSYGRIDLPFLQSLQLNSNNVYFLCGPPNMVLHLIENLLQMGIHKENIFYEKWIDNVFY